MCGARTDRERRESSCRENEDGRPTVRFDPRRALIGLTLAGALILTPPAVSYAVGTLDTGSSARAQARNGQHGATFNGVMADDNDNADADENVNDNVDADDNGNVNDNGSMQMTREPERQRGRRRRQRQRRRQCCPGAGAGTGCRPGPLGPRRPMRAAATTARTTRTRPATAAPNPLGARRSSPPHNAEGPPQETGAGLPTCLWLYQLAP